MTLYPYFVEHVKRTLLANPAFGQTEAARVRKVFGGGLHIHTTIEPRLQALAEEAATAYWSDADDPEVAIAVVRPADGHVVATVGGRDFARRQFDLATQARRQPGSTFKTFALVAALKQRMRLDTLVESGPATLDVGDAVWSVRSATTGPLSLRDATAHSSNGAFARLALELGGERIADQAASMGVTSEVGTNPAIVLGGLREGVTALELASAYGTLANAGVHVPVAVVTKVTDSAGNVVWRPDRRPAVTMDGESAWLATEALRAVVEEGTGKLARLDRPAAGKTGTVQGYRDAWFVGFTPQLSAAVWMGYPDAPHALLGVHGVGQVTGGTWPAQIWRRFMAAAHEGVDVTDFPYPREQTVTVRIDPVANCLATEATQRSTTVTGLPGELPAHPCADVRPAEPTPAPTAREPERARVDTDPSAAATTPTLILPGSGR